MTKYFGILLLAALLMVFAPPAAYAQADLSGHWEGLVQAPELTIDLQIDVARDAGGAYIGTISLPENGCTGSRSQRLRSTARR